MLKDRLSDFTGVLLYQILLLVTGYLYPKDKN